MITWTCDQPGRWSGLHHDRVLHATTTKVREGATYTGDYMWSTFFDGAWLLNADTLSHAKRAVALAADLPACIEAIQAEVAALEADPAPGHIVTARLGNARAAQASDDPAIIRTHAVHVGAVL